MRTYCIAQGTLVNALWWLNGKEILKEGICMHITDFAVQQKLTQHCKATILQERFLKEKAEEAIWVWDKADFGKKKKDYQGQNWSLYEGVNFTKIHKMLNVWT